MCLDTFILMEINYFEQGLLFVKWIEFGNLNNKFMNDSKDSY